MRRRRPIRRKNESKTFLYLQELLPNVPVEREVVINEPIYAKGKLIRHFIIVDFRFFVNGKENIVEFNGTQHYKPAARFGGKKALIAQHIRDEWLRNYCKEKGITLIELDGRVLRGKKIRTYLKSVL
jgi:hypothetical protein